MSIFRTARRYVFLACAAGMLVVACGSAGGTASSLAASISDAPPSRPLTTGHFEYVVTVQGLYVYDIDHNQRLVKFIGLPQLTGAIKGADASPVTGTLYISYGGDGSENGNGSLLAYNLRTDKVKWTKSYDHGVDSLAISPNGKTIYLPDGEASEDSTWYVVNASNGSTEGQIDGGKGPHNTIVSPDGKLVYLGPRYDNYLLVASTKTDKVIRRIGPLKGDGVRPFTVNGAQTLAFTTASGFLGFQVSDIQTGKVLYTVPIKGFNYNPDGFPLTSPSHGISLSPNEKELYVIDTANQYVHVYDVSGLPAEAPVKVADIKLQGSMSDKEQPCAYDCEKDGWLQHSRDGRFVYVGDAGDVINTATRKTVAVLPPLANTRISLEIDFRNGAISSTTTRSGMGYVRANTK